MGIIWREKRVGGRREKLLREMSNNPKNIRFEELESLLLFYGCSISQGRGGSSHYIVKHPVLKEKRRALTIPKDRPVKAIYVKQVLKLIEEIKEAQNNEE